MALRRHPITIAPRAAITLLELRFAPLCRLTHAGTSAAIDCFAGMQKAFSLPSRAEAGVCRRRLRASQRAKVLTLQEQEEGERQMQRQAG